MRYWIYWNDLVQGPFEPEELRSLRAFTPELPVCEEEGQDWMPAAAVSELLRLFETPQPAPAAYGRGVPPPPPAPRSPPTLVPLQGEFFNELAGQQQLFDTNGSKSYFYRPATEATGTATEPSLPPITTPFHFMIFAPAPLLPEKRQFFKPLPELVFPELEETGAGPVEPEPVLDSITIPKPPPPMVAPVIAAPPMNLESTVLPPVIVPSIPKPVPPPPILTPVIPEPPPNWVIPKPKPPSPMVTPVIPAPSPHPVAVPPVIDKPRMFTVPDFAPSRISIPDERQPQPPRLWFWIAAALAIAALAAGVIFMRRDKPAGAVIENPPPAEVPAAPAANTEPSPEPPLPQEPAPEPPAVVPAPRASIWQPLDRQESAPGFPAFPTAVALDAKGRLWVVDRMNNRLQVGRPSKNSRMIETTGWETLGEPGLHPGQFHFPAGLAVDAQGQIWVADQGNHRLQTYSPATKQWTTLGERGNAAGEFSSPGGVAVDAQGRIWVADSENHRLQAYDPLTQRWKVVGNRGSAPGEFDRPAAISFDARGRMWVVDQGNNRVEVFDPDTETWTTRGTAGSGAGEFRSPSAIALDAYGRPWVADQGNNRVQVYNPAARRWTILGQHGSNAGEFDAPASIAFDARRRVWVADAGNHRLQVAPLSTAVPPRGLKILKPAPPPPVIEAPLPPPPAQEPPPVPASAPPVEVKEPPPGVPGMTPIPVVAAPAANAPNPWRDKEADAIDLVFKQKIYKGKRTIGTNAKLIMEDLHEKELLHAADTGERLYHPDKVSWSALNEEGPRYRVYLNFMAWQANGERILSNSSQFQVDLKQKTVTPVDEATREKFFNDAAMLIHQHSAKADEIETLLGGVDVVNRHKLRAVIMKSEKQKDEQKKALAGLQAAEAKLQKAVVYFRTKYPEKVLQNIATAYGFTALMKGK